MKLTIKIDAGKRKLIKELVAVNKYVDKHH